MAESPDVQKDGNAAADEEQLPKLSPADYKVYNRLAESMNAYHNRYRQTWTQLYTAASTNQRPKHLSLRQFLAVGLDFCGHLETHHSIEETYIFPVLARKMPAFRRELQLLTQHKHIHAGLDRMRDYLSQCKHGERELQLPELKDIMDSFGAVLWQHLDDEVKQLGADNMRTYWSKQEMYDLPF